MIVLIPILGVRKIDRRLLKEIESGRFSDEEAKAIFGAMREKYKKSVRGFRMAMIFVALVMTILSITTLMSVKNARAPYPNGSVLAIVFFVVIYAVMFLVLWITQFAWLKAEYDDILEDNYPQLFDEYKL